MNKAHFVDLFAGCGGLSLGLEDAGFRPVFVNELNADALSTYLENRSHLGKWLYQDDYHCSDVKQMVVDKRYLTNLGNRLARDFGIDVRGGELDLVVGGPPCQGYSGIGYRRSYSVNREQLPSNYLYEDMVYVISRLRPKAFLFENVRGLLSARWTSDGEKGEIWNDVTLTFEEQLGRDYWIDWELVHAKEYGVPQNRPRVLMVGLRKDVNSSFKPNSSKRASGLLPEPFDKPAPDLVEVLGDLVDENYRPGHGKTDLYPAPARSRWQRMFRLDPFRGRVRGKGEIVTEHEYSNHATDVVEKFKYMLKHGGRIPPRFQTKKFAQRVLPPRWNGAGPTITATSLPDDYVHFLQPRSLTVREWARLQTFPDWYQFRGKRTTGGIRRAGNPQAGVFDREVPKYTQIGNAVPVQLAEAVGKHLQHLIGNQSLVSH